LHPILVPHGADFCLSTSGLIGYAKSECHSFLGVNYPSSIYGTGTDGAAPDVTPSYQLVSSQDPLFDPSESASQVDYWDVQQGGIGDCWLMASLAAVASRDPGAIWNMITPNDVTPTTPNGNGTYTVRFFEPDGAADYVTVDENLPDGGQLFASITHADVGSTSDSTELWVALIEKAYAQENVEGWLASNDPGTNAYQALNYISTSYWGTPQIFSAITGLPAGGTGVNNPGALGSAWLNGSPVELGTPDSPQESINGVNLVEGHVYAVVNYTASSGEFLLFSPWGLNGSYYTPGGSNTPVFCAGVVTATGPQVTANFFFGTDTDTAGSASASLIPGRIVAPSASDTAEPLGIGHEVVKPRALPAVTVDSSDRFDLRFFHERIADRAVTDGLTDARGEWLDDADDGQSDDDGLAALNGSTPAIDPLATKSSQRSQRLTLSLNGRFAPVPVTSHGAGLFTRSLALRGGRTASPSPSPSGTLS
jgi:Calpain family cysteine protease